MKTGFIIFAHGSSVETANEAVRSVADSMAQAGGFSIVHAAFLELARPDLAEAVALLAEQGVARVVVIPYFLTLGIHLQRDLPRIVAGLASRHPGLAIEVTQPLDGHPALTQILLDRARAAQAHGDD